MYKYVQLPSPGSELAKRGHLGGLACCSLLSQTLTLKVNKNCVTVKTCYLEVFFGNQELNMTQAVFSTLTGALQCSRAPSHVLTI